MPQTSTQLILETIVKGANQAQQKVKGIQNSVKSASKDIKKFSTGIAAVGAVAAAGIGLAVSEFAKFEKEMSNVKAITGVTGKEFESLKKVAEEMGRTTAFTAKEAAEGMRFLGMAGFEANEIIEALPATLDLAAASNIDLATSADIASNILSAFRLEAKDTTKVVDVLARTVTSSNVDMIQLSESMKFMGPTAAALKVSLEETSAVIGILGNAGLQGGIATRSLAGSFARLAEPTEKVAEKMKEVNLNFFDAKGEFIGLAGMVEQLEKNMADFTDQQRLATIATVFGSGSVKQMSVLMAAGSEEIRRYTKVLELSEGTARKMAQTQLDNLAGSFTLLKSAVSGLMIEMSGPLAGALKKVVDGMTDMINKITENIPKVKEMWQNNGLLRASVVLLAGAIGGVLVAAIGMAITAFGSLLVAVAPFMGTGMAIAGLVAGILWVGQNWEMISLKIQGIWNRMRAAFHRFVGAMAEAIQSFISMVAEKISAGANAILQAFKNVFDPVMQFIDAFATWVEERISKMYNFVRDTINGLKKLQTGLSISGLEDFQQKFQAPSIVRDETGRVIRVEQRAKGGPVNAGSPYIVGEKEPEYFIPDRSGSILPFSKMGGVTININTMIGEEEFAEKMGDRIVKELGFSTAF